MYIKRVIRKIVTFPIWLYQKVISPHFPSACIYRPTCSQYTKEAIMKHGFFKGFLLGVTRIGRCIGGLFIGGDDPVPEKFSFKEIKRGYKIFRRKNNKQD